MVSHEATAVPKVLVVCSIVPFPENRGDPVRIMGILRALQTCTEVHVWCVNTTGTDISRLRKELGYTSVHQDRVVEFQPDRQRVLSRVGPAGRYAFALISGVPVWIRQRESKMIRQAISQLTAADFAAVLFLGEAAGRYSRAYSGKWHWDKVNVLSASGALDVQEAETTGRKIAAKINHIAARRYEKSTVRRAHTVSVTNADEAERLYRGLGRAPSLVIPSVVQVPRQVNRCVEPRTIAWLGSLQYASNVSGLQRFLVTSWPDLARLGWRLRIIGSGLSDGLESSLTRFNNVDVVGFVENVSYELFRAEVGLVPIWSGGGTKMKTLTMMAHGLPVVATPMGAEGIPFSSSRPPYVKGDTPEQLAAALLEAYGSGCLEDVGSNGRELVRAAFSKEAITGQLHALVRASSTDRGTSF